MFVGVVTAMGYPDRWASNTADEVMPGGQKQIDVLYDVCWAWTHHTHQRIHIPIDSDELMQPMLYVAVPGVRIRPRVLRRDRRGQRVRAGRGGGGAEAHARPGALMLLESLHAWLISALHGSCSRTRNIVFRASSPGLDGHTRKTWRRVTMLLTW